MAFALDSIVKRIEPQPVYSWLETLAICVIAIVMGLLVNDKDPFFTQDGSFPWTLLAPLLVGLRYGFLQAFVATLLIIISNYFMVLIFEKPDWQLSTAYSLGMLLSAMLTGEFRDIWERRIKRLTMANEYRQARLEEFTRNYHVLKLSHDQLEQDSAGQTRSLRAALQEVQQLSVGEINRAAADSILSLYKHYCMVQVAGIYRVDQGGTILREPLANVGNIGYLDIADPLVEACREERTVVSIASLNISESMRSRYVTLVPLIDTQQRLHALLAIKTLPFMALEQKNLRLMAILSGRLADCISAGQAQALADEEDANDFYRQLQRVLAEAQRHQLHSSLLAIDLRDRLHLTDLAQEEKRGLDLLLETNNTTGHRCQLLLMPLSGKDGLARFRLRFEDKLREQYRMELQEAGVSLSAMMINEETSAAQLREFLANVLQCPASEIPLALEEEH